MELQFNSKPNMIESVGQASTENQRAQREMQKISKEPNDWADATQAIQQGTNTATTFINANNIVKANDVRTQYEKLTTQEGYVFSTDADKYNALQKWLGGYEQDSVEWKTALSLAKGEIGRSLIGIQKQAQVDYLNSFPTMKKTWETADSGLMDEEGMPLTNEEAGVSVAEFQKQVIQQAKELNIEPQAANYMLISDQVKDWQDRVTTANSTEELVEIQKQINEEASLYLKDKLLLKSTSKQARQVYQQKLKEVQTAIKAKKKELQVKAKQEIETGINKTAIDPVERYNTDPNEFTWDKFAIAYGDTAPQKWQEYTNKKAEYDDLRDKMTDYDTNSAMHADWSGDSDLVKEAKQRYLDKTLINSLRYGTFTLKAEDIKINGGASSNRLTATREAIKANLLSRDEETAKGTYTQLALLHNSDPAAFNTLFPKEQDRAMILAIAPLMKRENINSIRDAVNYVLSNPNAQGGAHSSSEKNDRDKFIYDEDIPIAQRKERQVLYNTLASYGLTHSEIMDVLDTDTYNKAWKLDFSGHTPKVQDYLTESAQQLVEKGRVYEDPTTSTIVAEDPIGVVVKKVDKNKFIQEKNNITDITKWRNSHPIKEGFESLMDKATSLTSKAADVWSSQHKPQNDIIKDRLKAFSKQVEEIQNIVYPKEKQEQLKGD